MSDSHVQRDLKICLTIFPILAGLILLTVFVHQSHLSYNIQVAIELIKACIVVGYFMHLVGTHKDIHGVWLNTIFFVAGMIILTVGHPHSYLVGTVDTSKQYQAEQAAAQPAGGEEHEEHVH
jgi:caa(3)-type oxidase subunit IV